MKTDANIKYDLLNNPDSGYFECQLPIEIETEKAIAFDTTGADFGKSIKWIPKSQMIFIEFPDSDRRIFIKNWLYKKLN